MRRPLVTIIITLAVLTFLYVVAAGLGLTRNFNRHRAELKSQMINDFEHAQYDFDWTTGGYVQLEPSSENKTHGKYCGKAAFLLYTQFYATPTPYPNPQASMSTPAPTASVPGASTAVTATPGFPNPPSWQPEMVLDNRSPTPLGIYEWQDYANLKMDVFNAQDQPVSWHIQIADSRGYTYRTEGALLPRKVNNLVMPLDDTGAARLDLSNMRSFSFGVDLNGFAQPVVVYMDNLRLEGDAKAPKPQPVVSPTPRH